MNRWLVGSGAIVSSTVAIYGWANPSALNLPNAQADSNSKPLPKEIEVVYDRLLDKAQAEAKQDQIAEAITAIASIPKNSHSYSEAQQLQEDWTQELLQRAKKQYQQANVNMAMWMIKAIPPHSQRYARATELKQRWTQESALLSQATAAKNNGDWTMVMNTLNSLKESSLYHSFPAQALLQQATTKLYDSTVTVKVAAAPPADEPINLPNVPLAAGSPISQQPQMMSSPDSVDREQALELASPSPDVTDAFSAAEPPIAPAPQMSSLSPEFVPLEWTQPTLSLVTPPTPAPISPSSVAQPLSSTIAPTADLMALPPENFLPSSGMPADANQSWPAPDATEDLSWIDRMIDIPISLNPNNTENASIPQLLPNLIQTLTI